MESGSIIGKAVVSIEYNGRTDGLELQQAVNDWWDKLLMPEIETLVRSMDDDIWVRIQEIACDITINASEDWQQAARRQVLSRLEDEISSRKNNLPEADITGMPTRRADGAQRKTSSRHFIDEWLFYLQMGFMPWWSSEKNAQKWTGAIERYIEHTAVAVDVRSLAAYVTTPAVGDRLAAQLQGPLFWKFLTLFSTWDTSFISDVQNRELALIETTGNSITAKHFLSFFRKTLINAAANNYAQKEVVQLLKETIVSYAATGGITAEELFRSMSAGVTGVLQDIEADAGTADSRFDPEMQAQGKKKEATEQDGKAGETGTPGGNLKRRKENKARTAEDLFAGIDAETNPDAVSGISSVLPDITAGSTNPEMSAENDKIKTTDDKPGAVEGSHRPEAEQSLAEKANTRTAEELFAGIDTADNSLSALTEPETATRTGAGDIAPADTASTDQETRLQGADKSIPVKAVRETEGRDGKGKNADQESIAGKYNQGGEKNAEELWNESFESIADGSDDSMVKEKGEAAGAQENTAAKLSAEAKTKAEQARRAILKKEMHAAAEEGIYIQNAGVVIIAVYLGTFFRNMGLVNDDAITDMSKAIALLHYLATRSAEFAEFEVVLPKILCGIEPDEFVDTSYSLTEEDKQEAEGLLEAVIENWPALKSTSTDSLRGTFLTREGKLIYRDGSWRLYVQEQPLDILVDMLPWNISMIYLPWMPSMLHVNWRNS